MLEWYQFDTVQIPIRARRSASLIALASPRHVGHSERVRLAAVGAVALSVVAVAGCASNDVSRMTNACDLLSAREVGAAVGATAQPGVLTSAIGENIKRICTFSVSGDLGTGVVYLGKGSPPSSSAGRAVEASGDEYVIVFSQYVGHGFEAEASDLAHLAIGRAIRG